MNVGGWAKIGWFAMALSGAALAGCGGADSAALEDGSDSQEEAELRAGCIDLELRDDGNLHAVGLHHDPASGDVWDHYVRRGERIRLRNKSSQPAFFVVTSESTFADGRPHHVLFETDELLRRELRPNRGSFSWTVSQRARFFYIGAYADEAAETNDLIRDLISEPDGASTFGAMLTVDDR